MQRLLYSLILIIYIMYLSFNNKSFIILLISVIIFFIQINLPSIIIYENNQINLDLILVFLTVLVFLKIPSYKIIFAGFFYGLIQDIIIGVDQIGLFGFIKSVTVFLLLYIRDYDNIWLKGIKLLYIFVVYFFHFTFYYFII